LLRWLQDDALPPSDGPPGQAGGDEREDLAVIASEAKPSGLPAVLDCVVAERVIGPAASGRARWLLATTAAALQQPRSPALLHLGAHVHDPAADVSQRSAPA
jgi:hypothetical protein